MSKLIKTLNMGYLYEGQSNKVYTMSYSASRPRRFGLDTGFHTLCTCSCAGVGEGQSKGQGTDVMMAAVFKVHIINNSDDAYLKCRYV